MAESTDDGQAEYLIERRKKRHRVGVVGAVFVVGVVGLMLLMTTSHHSQHHLRTSSVGVVLAGSPLDQDTLRAVRAAARDHEGGLTKVLEQHTDGGVTGAVEALRKLLEAGVQVVVVGGEDPSVTATLCQYLYKNKLAVMLVTPSSTPACPHNLALTPSSHALLTAQVAQLAEAGVEQVMPVLVTSQRSQLQHLREAGVARGMSVVSPVYLGETNVSLAEVQDRLAPFPRAAVLLALDHHLPHLLPELTPAVCGRPMVLHAHPAHLAALLRHAPARRVAEECGVTSMAWVGSTPLNSAARRRLLLQLRPLDPVWATLMYDTTRMALSKQTPKMTHQDSNDYSTPGLMHNSGGPSTAGAARLRLLPKKLIKSAVVQDSPWLLEGTTWVTPGPRDAYQAQASTHAPTHVMTHADMLEVVAAGQCGGSSQVEVTTNDPLTQVSVSASWRPETFPPAILLPNSSPRGFTVAVRCSDLPHHPRVEIGCRGASTHHQPLTCVVATTHQGRRLVRSVLAPHSFHLNLTTAQPFHHSTNHIGTIPHATQAARHNGRQKWAQNRAQVDGGHLEAEESSYTSYEMPQHASSNQQSQPHTDQQMQQVHQSVNQGTSGGVGRPVRPRRGGFLSLLYKKAKGLYALEDFKSIVPQIGGCVGATAGCAFCFIYLLYFDVAISTGVCMGACSLGVGGSCTTLLTRGLQIHLDHTVICSELFQQGRLPLVSYLADASFGSRIGSSHPQGLRGYQVLAAPLVAAMQVSPGVTAVVEAVAQPWIRHMEYEEGLRFTDDTMGSAMTQLGLPVCSFVAGMLDHADTLILLAFTAALWHRARS